MSSKVEENLIINTIMELQNAPVNNVQQSFLFDFVTKAGKGLAMSYMMKPFEKWLPQTFGESKPLL